MREPLQRAHEGGAATGAAATAAVTAVAPHAEALHPLDPWQHQGVLVEDERAADGRIARTATVFLTGRTCPWHCVMCDLWRYTIAEDTPIGAIPAQVASACAELRTRHEPVTSVKLYNAGSFFDPRAVPERDYGEVAAALAGMPTLDRVIVESHPSLIGPRVDRLRAALDGRVQLEVAMGLETAHPDALDRLDKRITLAQFAAAAEALHRRAIALRVFLLIAPPFIHEPEQAAWLLRSVDAAFACGASVVSLVPTRLGNAPLDALAADGSFRQPTLDEIERATAAALTHARGRGHVFVDLWDLDRFADCTACLDTRRARLHAMNLSQCVPAPLSCARCDRSAAS